MTFPAEAVPDGDVFAPHHVYVGTFLVLFGFVCVWPYYPKTGASIALLGTALVTDDVVSHSLGIPMPFDWLFDRFIHERLS